MFGSSSMITIRDTCSTSMITIRIPWDTYLFYLTDHNWDPISIIDTFLCLKCIVFDLCSHISVQGKWLVLNCPLIGGFTNTGCQILGGLCPPPPQSGYWGGGGGCSPPSPPPPLAPTPLYCDNNIIPDC